MIIMIIMIVIIIITMIIIMIIVAMIRLAVVMIQMRMIVMIMIIAMAIFNEVTCRLSRASRPRSRRPVGAENRLLRTHESEKDIGRVQWKSFGIVQGNPLGK